MKVRPVTRSRLEEICQSFIQHIGSTLRIERPVKLPLAVVVQHEFSEGLVERVGVIV